MPLITVPVEGAGSRHASLEAKIAELEDSGAVNIHVSRDEDKFLVTYDVKRGPGRPTKIEVRAPDSPLDPNAVVDAIETAAKHGRRAR